MRRRHFLAWTLTVLASGCGFRLRGQEQKPLAFTSLYINGDASSPVTSALMRNFQNHRTVRLVSDPKTAQATLNVLADAREKVILALSGGGKVREFELRHRVSFRVASGDQELIAPSEILITRSYTFSDDLVLAKETEEAVLYRDMLDDAVQQIMRRLEAVTL